MHELYIAEIYKPFKVIIEISGCRLTDLELTTRNSRFGINTAVVPAPIENFYYFNDPLFISTLIVVSQ